MTVVSERTIHWYNDYFNLGGLPFSEDCSDYFGKHVLGKQHLIVELSSESAFTKPIIAIWYGRSNI